MESINRYKNQIDNEFVRICIFTHFVMRIDVNIIMATFGQLMLANARWHSIFCSVDSEQANKC